MTTVRWRKSSYSSDTNTCVQIALTHSTVGLRDSKNPTGPTLTLPTDSFTTLVATLSA